MLYSNVSKTVVLKKFPFGDLLGIVLGEDGRGRIEIFIPVRANGLVEKSELFPDKTIRGLYTNPNLGLGVSKSGRPIIVDASVELYDGVILCSYGGYTRRGNGYVDNIEGGEILAKGIGADGDAGRIGTWEEVLIKPIGTLSAHVRYSGGLTSHPEGVNYYLKNINGQYFFMREEDFITLEDLE